MGVMRKLESRIERAVEVAFRRSSKAEVQAPELARKLAKEMDDHKNPVLSQTFVPNVYTVYLCSHDFARFNGYHEAVAGELEDSLRRHAREANLQPVSRIQVRLTEDAELSRGQFGILAEAVKLPDLPLAVAGVGGADGVPVEPRPAEAGVAALAGWDSVEPALAGQPAASVGEAGSVPDIWAEVEGSGPDGDPLLAEPDLQVEVEAAGSASAGGAAGSAADYAASGAAASPAAAGAVAAAAGAGEAAVRQAPDPGGEDFGDWSGRSPSQTESIPAEMAASLGLSRQTVVLRQSGRAEEFNKSRVLIGRAREVDYQVEDPNVSRRHALIFWQDGKLYLKDLGSTNGTLLNGQPIVQAGLYDGDIIMLGGSQIVVETG